MAKACDYSWARPGGTILKQNGFVAVGRYLDQSSGKGLTKAELDDLTANGIATWVVYEGDGVSVTTEDEGVRDAKLALAALEALGTDAPAIYFAIDSDANPVTVLPYFQGIATVIPVSKIGAYGSFAVVESLIGGGHATWGWQTYAWSYGKTSSKAHIYQYSNGHMLNGSAIDYDSTMVANFGQIGATPVAAAPVQGTMTAPRYPLPNGYYFGPESGPVQSVSGYYSHRGDLAVWQQRMKDRGWGIHVDGLYGPETAGIAHAFQLQKGLTPDSLIGPQTWNAAWTSPVT